MRPPYRRARQRPRPPRTARAMARTETTTVSAAPRRKSGRWASVSPPRAPGSTDAGAVAASASWRPSQRLQRARMAWSSPSPIIAASAPSTGARHDERLAEGIVSPREGDAGAPRGRHLDAVQRDVEVATLERRDERLPVVLHELGPHAEAAGEAVGDLDLEPREPGARTQILEDVGLAPLHVAPPPERAAGPQPGKRVGARHAGAAGGAEHNATHDRERGDEREARRGVRFTGACRARQ